MHTQTIHQYRDLAGDLWCIQISRPQGKSPPYVIVTTTNITRNISVGHRVPPQKTPFLQCPFA